MVWLQCSGQSNYCTSHHHPTRAPRDRTNTYNSHQVETRTVPADPTRAADFRYMGPTSWGSDWWYLAVPSAWWVIGSSHELTWKGKKISFFAGIFSLNKRSQMSMDTSECVIMAFSTRIIKQTLSNVYGDTWTFSRASDEASPIQHVIPQNFIHFEHFKHEV